MNICSCKKADTNDELVDLDSITPNDPAHIVADILKSMDRGEIDHTKIIYEDKQKPLPVIHSRRGEFHGVKFNIEEIKLSKYDANTKTVSYSCRVPHPAIVFWQYVPIKPDELVYMPKGIPMKGQFVLVKEGEAGFKIRVNNGTNPISLYNKVVISINGMWYMSSTTVKPSPEAVNFNVLMLIANYATALNIPEKNSKRFAEDILEEFQKVVPRPK